MSPQKQPIFPPTHFARFGRWLEMESRAERQRLEDAKQALEKMTEALGRLTAAG